MELLIKGKIKQMHVIFLILVIGALFGCDKGTVVLKSTSVLDNCGSVAARNTIFANSALGGNGDSIPWQICTTTQFQNIENDLTAKYEIINDLDFSNISNIGFSGTFEGDLDGKGYNISNVSISGNSLFEKAKGAKISNMTLENWRVDGSGADVGALFSNVESDDVKLFEIDQIIARNLIVNSSSGVVGGLIGQLGSVTTTPGNYKLTNIDFEGDVTGAGSYTGGLIGYVYSDYGALTIANSKVKSVLSGTSYLGGLYGYDGNGNTHVTDILLNQIITLSGTSAGGVFGRTLNSQAKFNNISGAITINHSGTTGSVYLGGTGGYLFGTDTQITNTQLDVIISTTGSYSAGLFGYSRGPLTTENVSININIDGRAYIGGLIGYQYLGSWFAKNILVNFDFNSTSTYMGGVSSYVRNSDLTIVGATITGKSSNATSSAGGVLGSILLNTLTMDQVKVLAEISDVTSYAGGLIGRVDDTLFSISKNTDVNVTITGGTSYFGGAIGYSDQSGEILGGVYKSQLITGSRSGGILGRIQYALAKGITISGATVDTSITSTGTNIGGVAGEISQYSKISNVTVVANISTDSDYQGLAFGYVGANTEINGINIIGTISGSATASDTVGGVAGYIRNDVSLRNANVSAVLSGRNSMGGLVGYASSNSNINNSDVRATITGGDNVGGVSGYLATGSSVSLIQGIVDLNGERAVGGVAGYITNTSIHETTIVGTITNTLTEDAAGLVAYMNTGSSINNSSASVTISSTGTARVGGLVGYQRDSSITNSWSSGRVSNSGFYTGGLSAYVFSSSGNTFSNVYSTMNITGEGYTGGLIGNIDSDNSTLEKCFYSGTINLPSGSGVGGFIGRMYGNQNNFIQNCYADANISSSVGFDGPIYGSGNVLRVETTSVYYNSDHPDPGFGNTDGTALTSTQMLTPANFVNFDFTTPLWEAPTGSYLLPGRGSYSYPILKWMK